MRVPLPTVRDPRLIWRRIRVDASQVSFVRGILEASDGLASMFAERGGDLLLVSTVGQSQHLDELVHDLCDEIDALLLDAGDSTRPFVPTAQGKVADHAR